MLYLSSTITKNWCIGLIAVRLVRTGAMYFKAHALQLEAHYFEMGCFAKIFAGLLPELLCIIIYTALTYDKLHFGDLQLELIVKRCLVIECAIQVLRTVTGQQDYENFRVNITLLLIILAFTFSTYLNAVEKLHLLTCFELSFESMMRFATSRPAIAPVNLVRAIGVVKAGIVLGAAFILLFGTLYILPAHLLRWCNWEWSIETLNIVFSCLSLVLRIVSAKSVSFHYDNYLDGTVGDLIFLVLVVSSNIPSK